MKLLTILALFGAAVFGSAQTGRFEAHQGKPLPSFRMTDLKGRSISNRTLRGKVVLLDFWATWCGPCKAASPTMEALHRKYASKGLVVIGAETLENSPATQNGALGYAREHGYTYNFTTRNDALTAALGIEGIPAFVVIDRKGVVRGALTGFSSTKTPVELDRLVRKLLAQR